MSPDWRGGGPWRRSSRHRDRHRRQGRLFGGHAAGGAPVCSSSAVRRSRTCRRLNGLSLEATHPREVEQVGGWARVRVVERAEAPRQSESAVGEVRRCPGWRRLAHDEELPCGNSHSTTRFCLCAQLRRIESVSPPTLPNVGEAQNRRVLDGTFAHGHGTSAHTRSVAGSSPSLPRQTVPKRAPKRRRQATFRHSLCPA